MTSYFKGSRLSNNLEPFLWLMNDSSHLSSDTESWSGFVD